MRDVLVSAGAVLLLGLLFASCAIHQPMSEMVMFQKKKAYSDSTYFSKYSHSIGSLSAELNLEPAVLDYVGETTVEDERKSYGNPVAFTTNLIFLHEKHQNVGFSIALGPLIYGSGLDLTYNIFEHYYLTGAVGLGNETDDLQYQFIFQRRFLDGNPVGLSFGAVGRRNFRYVNIANSSFIGGSQDFFSRSVGIRSVLTYSPTTFYGESRFFLHGTGSFNYDFRLKAFYPRVGLSFGLH